MDDTLNNGNTQVPNQDNNLDPTEHVPPTNTLAIQDTNPEDLESRWLRWKCLNCGYLYEGMKELKKCPRCGNENPDMFEDAD